MSFKTRVTAPLLGAASLISLFALAPTAQADSAHSMACGYYETQTDAYYGHCGNSYVKVQVDIDWWPTDILRCLPPGETRLGSTSEVDNAWAIGTC
ncbi:DUF6355 family natural product biosynthesis protein [Streptomyces sp. NPDC093544]|jgi:hypothetical protein|uniref:DUF6355 family natural product biosynthesis protein n=1 Tax=Streptomyces sp. NPDC093544 TaxID=3155200 RepID=UPI0034396A4B